MIFYEDLGLPTFLGSIEKVIEENNTKDIVLSSLDLSDIGNIPCPMEVIKINKKIFHCCHEIYVFKNLKEGQEYYESHKNTHCTEKTMEL